MKKYFVLALALMAFAVAPIMADVALSGEYSYSAMWNTSDSEFDGTTDKLELDAKVDLDDYNTLKMEFEDNDKGDNPNGEPLTVEYAKVITDWGKYFGFAETGFGVTTTTGLFDIESKETADFTGYNLEYGYTDLGTASGFMSEFNIMDMVNVYYGQKFDTYGDKGFLFGAVVDIEPVAVEVYYRALGLDPAIGNAIGLEAAYGGEVADGVELTAAASLSMIYGGYNADGAFDAANDKAEVTGLEEFNTQYGFGIGVSAYGATLNASFTGLFLGADAADAAGDPSYAFSMLGIDGEYAILDWLGVNAGFLMNMGDYAKDFAGDEAFSGAEFGVSIMPGAVTYQFGYVVANEDAGNYINIQSDAMAAGDPLKAGGPGGIYFIVDLDY